MPTDYPFVPLVGGGRRGRWGLAQALAQRDYSADKVCFLLQTCKLSNEPKQKTRNRCPNPYNPRNPHHRKISQEQQPLSPSSVERLQPLLPLSASTRLQVSRERRLVATKSNPLSNDSSGVQSTAEEILSLLRKPFARSFHIGRSFLSLPLFSPPSTLPLHFYPSPGLVSCRLLTPSPSQLQRPRRIRAGVVPSSPCPALSTTAHTPQGSRRNRKNISECI